MMLGIEQARPGNTMCDVGHAIQSHAEKHRYGVVRDFCGHGLGRVFHDAPNVVHVGRPGAGIVLKPGMFFTIEPMINGGRPDVKVLDDGWTAVTRDRSLRSEEHTSELQSLMRISYAVFCLKKKKNTNTICTKAHT